MLAASASRKGYQLHYELKRDHSARQGERVCGEKAERREGFTTLVVAIIRIAVIETKNPRLNIILTLSLDKQQRSRH